MKKDILVITSRVDTHADFICPKLEECGVRVFRFDTDGLNQFEIDFRICPDLFSIKNKKTGASTSRNNVGSVWFRKPSPDRTHDEIFDEASIKFSRGEGKELIKSISMTMHDCFWITDPLVLYSARIKAIQLTVAQKIGLRVPRTIISKDKKLIREFFGSCERGVVIKTLKTQYIESTNHYYTLGTHEISRKDLRDPDTFLLPSVFQEKISVSHELRIVALGRRLYPFKVVRKNGANILDIRANEMDDLEFTPCKIPEDLYRKILAMLEHFGLFFSSMDFLVDTNNHEYFIDLNPNGQWLWLEFKTGVNMSNSFVKMLVDRKIPT